MEKVSDKILKRVYLLGAMIALFSILIIVRVISIQYVHGEKWRSAVGDRIYERVYPAARGSILSEEGDVLAESQPFYYLSIDPALIDRTEDGYQARFDSLTEMLSAEFGEGGRFSQEYFADKIGFALDSGWQYLRVVNRLVDYSTFEKVNNWPILRNSAYSGGLLEEKLNNRRHYPFDNLARITLGLLDSKQDSIPLRGLEFAFHDYLRGQDGRYLVQRMPGGFEKPLEIRYQDQDGADVVTTLNVEMQDIVEEALQKGVKRHNANFGVALLMEVETGEIKALANYPENENRVITFRFEPGSTFKLASVLALFEDRYVHPADSIETGDGTLQFYDRVMRDHIKMGKITLYDAFRHSSNVAISKLVDHYYKDKLQNWFKHLENFGLTKKTMQRKHLVGERQPIITRPSDGNEWNGTTLPWMSIGYNTQLTPLQICAFYNAVANNGKYMEPMLVREIRQNSQTVERFEPNVLHEQIASERSIRIARKFMEGVVKEGTASNIKSEKFKYAGKTGTTKKFIDSLQIWGNIYQASFAGYFPADTPRYTCYIMVDEPRNGAYYGSNVAAPIFDEIAQSIHAADLEMVPWFAATSPGDVPLPHTRIVHQQNASRVYRELDTTIPREAEGIYVRMGEKNGAMEFRSAPLDPEKVPNVNGMSSRDALALLEGLGLRTKLIGHGKVANQSIKPGTRITPDTMIELKLR